MSHSLKQSAKIDLTVINITMAILWLKSTLLLVERNRIYANNAERSLPISKLL